MDKRIESLAGLLLDRQHNRILRLSFPHNDAPVSGFMVHKLDAIESLSRDFVFTVELLSEDASLALKDMQGKLLCVQLVCCDGSLRCFTGYVFSFRRKGADGSITYYEAELGPWLRFLSLSKDNYLFHNKTLQEQTDSIFKDYAPLALWEWRVTGEDPIFTDACQFDETDHNYLSRRWEAAGLYYWYEHNESGHTLVIADDSTLAPAVEGDIEVRFQSAGGNAEEDAIDRWTPVRQVTSSSVALSGFNFKTPFPISVEMPTIAEQGRVPDIETYEYVGAYGFRDTRSADALARVRMEELEADSRYFEAEGNNRKIMPGRWFQLTDHFNHNPRQVSDRSGRDEFVVITAHHTASNNYLPSLKAEATYRNRLTCTRRLVLWRPGRNFNSTATRILAPQTAIVVGPSGPDSVYTDEYGRIRVQFHWDRIGNRDECSSAWIRVASQWAGAEMGMSSIPRVGSEVIVQWLDGNPDRPIVTGSVYNEANMPPWSVPTQQSLMGMRSRELAPNSGNKPGGRSNHLILDDTAQKIQAQLKSDHQCSQLSLGNITRIEDTGGRKDERGEGWELATNAWGVLRAGKGMLVTTEARSNAKSHAKDMGETVTRLNTARQEHGAQARLAEQAGAQEPSGQQADVANDIHAQNVAIKGGAGTASTTTFPQLSEPALVLASPAGIATTTSQSTHFASGGNTAITAGKSVSIAASESFFVSVRKTLRLFVHKAGMKLVAAAGNIDVQALSDSINLLAKLNITLTATEITITAKERIVINGGGSYATFATGGIEIGTKGKFVVRSSLKEFESGNAMPVQTNNLPIVDGFNEQFRLVDEHEQALSNRPYRIRSACGKVWEGISDAQGMTQRVFTEKPSSLEIEILEADADGD
jgi:type VI secretion system secreted protein VgrG